MAGDRDEYEKAERNLEQAVAIYQALGLQKEAADSLSALGLYAQTEGEVEKAVAYYEQALATYGALGLDIEQVDLLLNLGALADGSGDQNKAAGYYDQAVAVYRKLGLREDEAETLRDLGQVADYLGQYERAVGYYQRAAMIYRELDLREEEAGVLRDLGLLADIAGDYDEALDCLEKAATIYRQLGLEKDEAETLSELTMAIGLLVLGQEEKAVSYAEQALTIYRNLGLEEEEAGELESLAMLMGQHPEGRDKAVGYLEQALAIYRKLGLKQKEANALNSLGADMITDERAVDYLEQAVAIYRELGLQEAEAMVLGNLGAAAGFQGRHDEAVAYHEHALSIYRELGREKSEAGELFSLGNAATEAIQYDKAEASLEQAVALYRKLGLEEEEAVALGNLGMAAASRGKYDEAVSYHKQALSIYRKLGSEQDEAGALLDVWTSDSETIQDVDAEGYALQAIVVQRAFSFQEQEAATLLTIGDLLLLRTGLYAQAGDPKLPQPERLLVRVLATWGLGAVVSGPVPSDLEISEEAASHYASALEIYRDLGLEAEHAATLSRLGAVEVDLGRHQEAAVYFEEALVLHQERGREGASAFVLASLGTVYFMLGRIGESLSCNERAMLTLRERELDELLVAGILMNMGGAASIVGDFQRALIYQQDAVETYRRLGMDKEEAGVLHNLAVTARRLGQHRRALQHAEAAREIYRRTGSQVGLAGVSEVEGWALYDLGEYDRALSCFEEAYEIYRSLGMGRHGWRNVMFTCEIHLRFGRLTEARAVLEKLGSRGYRDRGLLWGRYYLLVDQPEKAGELFREAQDVTGEAFSYEVAVQIGLGLALERVREWEGAAVAYRRAVGLIEQARGTVPAAERGHFFEATDYGFRRLEAYEGLARVMHRLGKEEEAFWWSEHTKARCLVESLSRAPLGSPLGLPADLREQEDSLLSRIAALSKLLQGEPQRKEELEAELRELRARLDALVARLRQEHPEYASIRYPQPLRADELALKPDEVLLSFEVTESETLAFLIRGDRIRRVFEIKVSRSELEALVQEFRLGFRQVRLRADLRGIDVEVAERLYELLLEQPLAMVQPDEHVLVVPDEVIGLLPLEALIENAERMTWRDGEHGPYPEGVEYVGDGRAFTYWQSGTAMTTTRNLGKQAEGNRVLVVADPVYDPSDARVRGSAVAKPADAKAEMQARLRGQMQQSLRTAYGETFFGRLEGCERTIHDLRALYGERLTALVGTEAREGRFKEEPLETYSHIVFATHGVLSGNSPWFRQPALVLSLVGNEPDQDGYLTMSEVMDLKLRAEMVALMACETGLGRMVGGEGVMAMGRAFQYAGARSVLASLWKAEDESTSLLTTTFLQELAAGRDKTAALRAAREKLRESGYSHPFYWAGFVLIGEAQPSASPM